MSGSRNFCQFYLVLSLFYSLKRGSNGFIAEKLILYKGSRGGPFFSGGGGVHLFPDGGGGPNANFYKKKKPIYVLVILQGECPDPLSPSGSAHGQCRHKGTIFIQVRPLTIIVRH